MRTYIPALPDTWALWVNTEQDYDHEQDRPYWAELVVAWQIDEDADEYDGVRVTPMEAGVNEAARREDVNRRVDTAVGVTETEATEKAKARWAAFHESKRRRAERKP